MENNLKPYEVRVTRWSYVKPGAILGMCLLAVVFVAFGVIDLITKKR